MKLIKSLVGFAIKLTLLASLVVLVLEVVDRMSEKNHFRYTVSQEFDD